MNGLPYIAQIVQSIDPKTEGREERPIAYAFCAGCGDTIALPATSAAARSTNLRVSDWRLVPGLGWVCDSCARAVYNGQRSSAL